MSDVGNILAKLSKNQGAAGVAFIIFNDGNNYKVEMRSIDDFDCS